MRAVTMAGPGGPEVLAWSDGVADPGPPGDGEVLIDVAATAVNRADLLQRQGRYAPPPGASDILGLECSGTIAAVGAGVEGWAIGAECCALLAGGGYAEQVVVPAGQVLPLPAGIDLVTAAGLPEVTCTVWSNVVDIAHLAAGETFLCHGGSSGIGTIAIQLAVALGARVAVTAGTPDKLARCRDLGADILVNYREQDFVEEVKAATDGHGANVVLDLRGASYLARNIDVLAPDGRLVIIGLEGGASGEISLGALLAKRGAVHATTLRGRPSEQKARIVEGVRREVWPMLESGRIRPVVHRVLPISAVGEAHALVASSEHVGKVILQVR